ncbi:hypothetical protein EV1_009233 [Malus domestica]
MAQRKGSFPARNPFQIPCLQCGTKKLYRERLCLSAGKDRLCNAFEELHIQAE